MTGEGEMVNNKPINSEKKEEDIYYTYLLPMSAIGGALSGFDIAGVKNIDCEKIVSPIANIDFAISVYGDSMSPEYPSGSHILINKINPNVSIAWGNVFVLDTTNGIIVKEIQPSHEEGKIICHSVNPSGKYKDFEVSMSYVRGIYRVLACITAK